MANKLLSEEEIQKRKKLMKKLIIAVMLALVIIWLVIFIKDIPNEDGQGQVFFEELEASYKEVEGKLEIYSNKEEKPKDFGALP